MSISFNMRCFQYSRVFHRQTTAAPEVNKPVDSRAAVKPLMTPVSGNYFNVSCVITEKSCKTSGNRVLLSIIPQLVILNLAGNKSQ